MSKNWPLALLAGAALLAGYSYLSRPVAAVTPPAKPAPAPKPKPKPCPPNRPCPRREAPAGRRLVGGTVGGPELGGAEIQCDLPGEFHTRNCGGSDGAGLCVFTSVQHAAVWQSVDALKDFQAWMKSRPGGGYPEKVDRMIKAKCAAAGVPVPDYVQVEGADLDILELACANGYMPGVTYSFSPTGRYGGRRISHMVSLVGVVRTGAGRQFVILDNNYPAPDKYEWLSEEEFRRTYTGGRSGWAVIFLSPGPPPVPHN